MLVGFVGEALAENEKWSFIDKSLATRPSLLDGTGGPKDAWRSLGIDFSLWLTQFAQGYSPGLNQQNWTYDGKVDAIVTVDFSKIGLWNGFSANLHQEWVWGVDPNGRNGILLPVNAAFAGLVNAGYYNQTSLFVTQAFSDWISLSLGKFNMFDPPARTPIMGGGGIDTFMNLAFAAPFTGIVPPYILGGNLTVKTSPANFTLMVYDSRNAQEPDVLNQPFAKGVTTLGQATVPLKLLGLDGFHNFRVAYSTQKSLDLTDIPQLALPAAARSAIDVRNGGWYLSYALQQYLMQSATDPRQGWGLFGQVSVSDANPNPAETTWFVGLGGTGYLWGRELDRWGAGFFRDNISPALQSSLAALGIAIDYEQGAEIFYNLAVTPWFRMTADLQFVRAGVGGQSFTYFGFRNQIKF